MIGGNKCNDSVVHVAVLTSISRTNSIKLYTEGKREEFKELHCIQIYCLVSHTLP